MAVKRLGKGLGALIPDISPEDLDQRRQLIEIEVSRVRPNPFQPRETFNHSTLDELKQSIAEKGVIQPISVRKVNSEYELIAGERRLRAVKELGHETIPAYILDVKTDEEMLELSLIENIQRENLNPIDEANGYHTLMTKCNLTQEEVAKKVGKDRTTITNFLRLLKLPEIIQKSLINGEITAGHARALLSVPDQSDQIALWKKIVKNKYSVRQVESIVRKLAQPQKTRKDKKEKLNPFIQMAEDKLRRILGTQVHIHLKSKGKGGKIDIEFYSDADLERILDLMEKI
ncbi:MAG: ParB/RepB/Spo0J family partition protein [Calditrichaeota bacterium]|nr:MAG: ParB/RepB/Spo0J family partition protein [Calditrichota bacterium]